MDWKSGKTNEWTAKRPLSELRKEYPNIVRLEGGLRVETALHIEDGGSFGPTLARIVITHDDLDHLIALSECCAAHGASHAEYGMGDLSGEAELYGEDAEGDTVPYRPKGDLDCQSIRGASLQVWRHGGLALIGQSYKDGPDDVYGGDIPDLAVLNRLMPKQRAA